MDAGDWDARYAATELIWSAGPNRFVEAELADLPPGRALDLACGEGRNARWLAARDWQVTAMDFSPVAIEKARALEPDSPVEWQVGDATTADLTRGLDLVLLAYLQVPAEDRTRVVRRAYDALADGGRLFVVAHDSTNLTEGTGGPQDARVLYTAEDVLRDLRDRPVEVLRAERVARPVVENDEHGSTGQAWDALVHLIRSAR